MFNQEIHTKPSNEQEEVDLDSGEYDLTNVVRIPPFKFLSEYRLLQYLIWLGTESFSVNTELDQQDITEEKRAKLRKDLDKIEKEHQQVRHELDRRQRN